MDGKKEPMAETEALRALEAHYRAMPPVAAMRISIAGYDGGRLRLHAPLPLHVNDKGCAFGGSLASLMTLAGWGSAMLRLGDLGADAEVYVQDSQIRYLAPVWQDIDVLAWPPEEEGDAFLQAYRERGRARTQVRAECRLADGTVAASLEARFVAIDPRRRTAAA